MKEINNNLTEESLCLYELKQHKPWFDEKCSQFLDERRQAKMQWFQDPNQSNIDNLNNIRREASRCCRNQKKELLRTKPDDLEINSKMKNNGNLCRGISTFKKGYQSRTNIVKDEKGDLVKDIHSILARWRNNFSQLLKVRGVNDVRQAEIHTAEPLML